MFSDIFFTLFHDFLGGVTEKRVSLLPLPPPIHNEFLRFPFTTQKKIISILHILQEFPTYDHPHH